MFLLSKQFQITALKERENTQQNIFDKHNFYKQIKEVNQIDKKLKQIKKRYMKWLKEWCDIVSEEAVIQNLIFYQDYHFWVFESIITELL